MIKDIKVEDYIRYIEAQRNHALNEIARLSAAVELLTKGLNERDSSPNDKEKEDE